MVKKIKKDRKGNNFIEWMRFYLRLALITESFCSLNKVCILYYVSTMSVACVSGWYMFYLKYDDLTLNTDALLHSVLVGHTLYVYIIYLRKRKCLINISCSMQNRFENVSESLNLKYYGEIWDKADNISLILMKLGSASCLIVYSTYILNALFSSERKLLYPLWMPFSLNSRMIYFFPMALQLTVFCLYSIIHVSGCGFCIGGSHFIGASFKILGEVFQDICKLKMSQLSTGQSQTIILEDKLKWCVRTHIEILGVIKEYKAVYESIILEVLLSCEVIICFAGFQTVLAVEVGDLMRAGTVLTMALLLMFHLFMFCYPGQHIYNKSEQFRIAVYLSHWEDHSMAFQRAVHLILLNTLKPVTISYKGILLASMSTFLKTLRAAFSYVNMLLILREVHYTRSA